MIKADTKEKWAQVMRTLANLRRCAHTHLPLRRVRLGLVQQVLPVCLTERRLDHAADLLVLHALVHLLHVKWESQSADTRG